MGVKKPKKTRTPKVHVRDVAAEQAAAAAEAARKANEDAAYRRSIKSKMMGMRTSSSGRPMASKPGATKTGGV